MAAGHYGGRGGVGGPRMMNTDGYRPPPPNPNFMPQSYGPPPSLPQQRGELNSGGYGPRNPGPNLPVELKLIFNRNEMAYLFGFDGVLVAQLCEQTGANIEVSEGECFEFVCCIAGNLEVIFKAFSLVCRKFWDFWTNIVHPGQQRPLVLRLAVPATQCGSIIGKQGAKIKEIRELSGANIQVSQESLPDSTERCVEVSGTGETCLQCVYHVCNVMQEVPKRPDNIPYIPKPRPGGIRGDSNDNWRPVFLVGDKAYVIEGTVARLAPPELLRRELSKTPLGGRVAEMLAAQGTINNKMIPDHMNPLNLMSAISNSNRGGNRMRTSREMPVSCHAMITMLKQSAGAKLDEIQRMSGAQLHVPGENEATATGQLVVTITGTEEAILLAQFLIQSNIDLTMKEMRDQQQQMPPVYGNPGYQDNVNNAGFHPDDGGFNQNRRRGGGNPNFRQNFRGGFNEPRFPQEPFNENGGRGGFNNDRGGGFRGGPPRGGGDWGRGGRGVRGGRW